MATKVWTGASVNRKQVNTLTPTVISAGSGSFTVTINGNDAVFASTSADSLATVCAGIVAAVNGHYAPEFGEVEASTNDVVVYITARTAGTPFTQTSSATGTSAALSTSTSTTNKSRNDWTDTANWAGGVVPVDTDDLIFEDTDQSVLWNISLTTILPASITVRRSYTGNFGLPIINEAGFIEYRTTQLTLEGITTLRIDHEASDDVGRFRIKVGANNCAATINGPVDSTPAAAGIVEWEGGAGTHTFVVNNGSLSIQPQEQDSITISTVTAVDSAIDVGRNVTSTTISVSGGSATIQKAPTTLNVDRGATVLVESGAATTVDVVGGASVIWQGGNITTLNVSQAKVDFGESMSAITITNCYVGVGFDLQFPDAQVTWTNGVNFYKCGAEDGTLNAGKHIRLTPGAYA